VTQGYSTDKQGDITRFQNDGCQEWTKRCFHLKDIVGSRPDES
jgi:hypothetical protein